MMGWHKLYVQRKKIQESISVRINAALPDMKEVTQHNKPAPRWVTDPSQGMVLYRGLSFGLP